LLRECLAIREKKLPDDWKTFNARSLLGAALAGQKKFTEAEPLLLQGYQGLKQCEAMIPADSKARPTEALERLVQHYEATNQRAQAAARVERIDLADFYRHRKHFAAAARSYGEAFAADARLADDLTAGHRNNAAYCAARAAAGRGNDADKLDEVEQ